MLIKEVGGKADATREARMITIITRSTGRTRNYTTVVKKDIRNLITQILKEINTTMTRAHGVPVVERA